MKKLESLGQKFTDAHPPWNSIENQQKEAFSKTKIYGRLNKTIFTNIKDRDELFKYLKVS